MIIDFSDGINTLEYMMLQEIQSEEYADNIIRTFKQTYTGGDPNSYLTQITDNIGLVEGDLTPASKQRIENEISNYLRGI